MSSSFLLKPEISRNNQGWYHYIKLESVFTFFPFQNVLTKHNVISVSQGAYPALQRFLKTWLFYPINGLTAFYSERKYNGQNLTYLSILVSELRFFK